ncbi:hypothetical protein JKF63_05293 [Porcisia hertigi]|uniref:Uncharacterized protein n=1 Tax=Porcisia hertigi TaxID=2761500 RepID=A0A836IG16_9TRYP|nr:hypothetical protein JKF63_05293 [Porcisia hertigi]
MEKMPVISTPFVMELRAGEELRLAQAPQDSLTASSSTASAQSTNVFAKNDFRALVNGLAFVEEETMSADGFPTAPKPHHKHSVVRVTLLACMRPPPTGSSHEHFIKTVTLASCNFSGNPPQNGVASNGASSAPRREAEESALSLYPTVTRVESTVQFHSPLLFQSNGNIQSLSVVAEDMATTAHSSGSSGSVRRYQGERRFVVRMYGIQETFLSKKQVLLLAQR